MSFPRSTWAGLLIATLGWGVLLSYPLLSPSAVSVTDGEARDPARYILIFGENAVITGLAIGILGALDRTLRLLGRIAGGTAAQAHPQARATVSAVVSSAFPIFSAAQPLPQANPSVQAPTLMPQPAPTDIITRGVLSGRDYVLFRDGSVVVETLLGPRRFPSVTDAQEFIGVS